MAKSKEKLEARKLRRSGESIKVIAKKINASVGSVSSWCRDIDLVQEQVNRLKDRVINSSYGKRLAYINKIKLLTNSKINNLKQEGIKEIGKLNKREIFLIGTALYWGEGFKKDHQVGLASSDIGIAKFYLKWLKICFNLKNKDLILRVTLNSSYKNKVKEIEEFWSKELKIPIDQFSKPFFQKTIWKKEYENKDQYKGVIRIKVRKSIDLLRKIYGYIEGLNQNVKS